MQDAMGTLATAIMTKDLDPDKAVALTAISTVLSLPMALATAILALENAKAPRRRPLDASPVPDVSLGGDALADTAKVE
jgi:hypothetical protein